MRHRQSKGWRRQGRHADACIIPYLADDVQQAGIGDVVVLGLNQTAVHHLERLQELRLVIVRLGVILQDILQAQSAAPCFLS